MKDPFPSYVLDHYPMNNSIVTETLEYDECEKSSNSLGFMELLNMQDFGPSFLDDILQLPSVGPFEALNAPATPNHSSISSESSDGHKDEQANKELDEEEDEDDDNGNHKTKKQLKPKKTSQKRKREPRFAFMTKSEVDHLEDGYRWRKYGQKAVKNSPFPRSYYRCTNALCNVKKRVERCCNDPSTVVTTYEGQHTHPSPQMPRAALPPPYSGFSAAPSLPAANYSVLLNGYNNGGMSFCSQYHPAALLTNNGLLQDVVPWSTIKKEE